VHVINSSNFGGEVFLRSRFAGRAAAEQMLALPGRIALRPAGRSSDGWTLRSCCNLQGRRRRGGGRRGKRFVHDGVETMRVDAHPRCRLKDYFQLIGVQVGRTTARRLKSDEFCECWASKSPQKRYG